MVECLVGSVGMAMANANEKSKLRPVEAREVISCQDLCVDYRELRALDAITGKFYEGTLTAIVGPNGGGKSTFLKALAGVQNLAKGSLSIQKQNVSYLPQSPDIDRSFPITVGDVVGMGLCARRGFFRGYTDEDREAIRQALVQVGLEDYENRPIHCLSGGQFQRVLFARIALQDASIILLDEPFAAIDAVTMDILTGVLRQWQTMGKTIITVLHDMDIVRDYFPDTVILARSAIAWGKTSEVLTLENLRQAKVYCVSWESSCTPLPKKRKLKTVGAGV